MEKNWESLLDTVPASFISVGSSSFLSLSTINFPILLYCFVQHPEFGVQIPDIAHVFFRDFLQQQVEKGEEELHKFH